MNGETNSLSNVAKKVLEYQRDEEIFTEPSEIVLTKDFRCKRCVDRNLKECIIQIGLKTQKQVYCKKCRQDSKSLFNCKPDIKILQKSFPNHPQINYTKDLLESYEKQINQDGSKNKQYFTHFPRKSLRTTKDTTPNHKNQSLDKPSQVASTRSNANMFVDVSAQPSSSAVTLPSTVSSHSISPSVNGSSYEHQFAQPLFSPSNQILSSIPVSSSVQTQASSNLVTNENRAKETDLISEDIQGVMDIMLQQQRLMCESIKRRIENL